MPTKSGIKPKKLTFNSVLENIAEGKAYFAVSVPAQITKALKTVGPVPISGRINGSEEFLASLYPIGGGRHYLRVRNVICKSVNIKKGSKVRVEITVRNRNDEVSIPKDLMAALKEEDLVKDFKDSPIGQRSYLIRLINEAIKPETRAKKVQAAVDATHERREKKLKS